MKRLFKLALAALVATAVLPGTGHAQNWRLHTLVKDPHPYNEAARHIIGELDKVGIKVKLFPSGTLGNDPTVFDEMRLGTVDVMISSSNNAAKHVPELQVFSLAYLWPGYEAFTAATGADGPMLKRFQALFEQKNLGIKLLGIGSGGSRNMSNGVKAVETVADIQGMKMRVPPSPVMLQVWEALGTQPVSVAWTELYAAIQTGVAQALESSIAGYTGSKLYEVAPYLALTQHEIQAGHVSVSQRSFDKLNDEQKAAVIKAGAEAAQIMTETAVADEEKLLETLKKDHGVTVTKPKIAGFQEKVEPLHESLARDMGATDLLKTAREVGKAHM
ncbi:MAG: TRAP transporter substrate-binding protein [Acetobacterales bacterium]